LLFQQVVRLAHDGPIVPGPRRQQDQQYQALKLHEQGD
jgi:hypothetical protein